MYVMYVCIYYILYTIYIMYIPDKENSKTSSMDQRHLSVTQFITQ
jgi:hypothetical protein